MNNKSIRDLIIHYNKFGWVIINDRNISKKILDIKKEFVSKYRKKFTEEVDHNRNLIKRLSGDPLISNLFSSNKFIKKISNICNVYKPIFCGPIVTHYTSNDKTGNSYGLPFHQDYPSMASSTNSIICWFNLSNSSIKSHGIELVQGSHKSNIFKGKITNQGYLVKDAELINFENIIPKIKLGEVLIFSSFLVHRTYVNPEFKGWKLSFSLRFDDLENNQWKEKKFISAYQTTVDRKLFLD